jgi:hypothetical protein
MKKPEPETCPNCGAVRSDEEVKLAKTRGNLVCPECSRDGCFTCMPAGRNCICPECEEGASEEP